MYLDNARLMGKKPCALFISVEYAFHYPVVPIKRTLLNGEVLRGVFCSVMLDEFNVEAFACHNILVSCEFDNDSPDTMSPSLCHERFIKVNDGRQAIGFLESGDGWRQCSLIRNTIDSEG